MACFALVSCGIERERGSKFLDDVDPLGDFGTLELQAPSGIDLPAEAYKFTLINRVNQTRIPAAALQTKYRLASGEYCVQIESRKHSISHCGYTVLARQDLIVKLAIMSVTWDLTNVDVQLGPKPWFELTEDDTIQIDLKSNNSFYNAPGNGQKYLLPAGQLKVSYLGVKALAELSKNIVLPELGTVPFDITPADKRIAIHVIAEKNKFPRPTSADTREISSYGVVSFSNSSSATRVPYNFSSRDSDESYSGRERTANWIKIPLFAADSNVSVSVKAFPLETAEGSYTMTASGVSKSFQLLDLQTMEFELEPVNVSHINLNTPGFYHYFQIDDGGRAIQIGMESEGTVVGSRFGTVLHPTQSTLYMLHGFRYRIISFLKDDTGTLVQQSSHDLDYR
jgi:hypothetical protein